jgi:hypothetical protein
MLKRLWTGLTAECLGAKPAEPVTPRSDRSSGVLASATQQGWVGGHSSGSCEISQLPCQYLSPNRMKSKWRKPREPAKWWLTAQVSINVPRLICSVYRWEGFWTGVSLSALPRTIFPSLPQGRNSPRGSSAQKWCEWLVGVSSNLLERSVVRLLSPL